MSNRIEATTLPVFPDEYSLVQSAREGTEGWRGMDAVTWGLGKGALKHGNVVVAEVTPSLRCPESCTGCPDSSILTKAAIDRGEIPKTEPRAETADMLQRISELKKLGVEHVMNIGGTIDHLPELSTLIGHELKEGIVVSWFTDGISLLDENGWTNRRYEQLIEAGWLTEAATHVSTDYVFGESLDQLLVNPIALPTKKGRIGEFRDDPEYSRMFKSQYGAALMRRLIEGGARRVVANMTISKANHDQVMALYEQAAKLQEYAEQIGSPTEVLFTFSPWVWRPHQARGDNPAEHSPADALGSDEMPAVNAALSAILDDTYERIANGQPRILANSSGYTSLHAEKAFADEAVWQDVGYPGARPLILNITPTAELNLDPMFKGPELEYVRGTFGYMDRTYKPDQNPFSRFHHGNRLYLPNIIPLESRDNPNAQPVRTMDYRLAHMIVKRGVAEFGESLMNKGDSRSVMFNPRKMLTDPFDLRYLKERLAHLIEKECDGDTVIGIASSGLGLSMLAAELAGRRNLYVKLQAEPWKGKRFIEGDVSQVQEPKRLTLVDDLLFANSTKKDAIRLIGRHDADGNFYPDPTIESDFNPDESSEFTYAPGTAELDPALALAVTDSVVIVDRQLERVADGPSLIEAGVRNHSLIKMGDIVHYMLLVGAITPQQLARLIEDYRGFDRHDMPAFARED